MRFVKLTRMTGGAQKGEPVFVNPLHVLTVDPGQSGGSHLHMSSKEGISVFEDIDIVISELDEGLATDEIVIHDGLPDED